MKELKPIENKELYIEIIKKKILEYWFEVLFKPLFDILEENNAAEKLNAKTTTFNLEKAIYDGKIVYEDGQFIGQFNAKISRELRLLGAKFNATKKTFVLPLASVPMQIKVIIVKSNEDTKAVYRDIDSMLTEIEKNINSPEQVVNLEKAIEHVMMDLDKQYKGIIRQAKTKDEQIKGILETLAVKPDLSQQVKDEVAKNYTNNLNLYIKNWNAEAIPELRKKVQEISFAGYRRNKIQQLLQTEYGSAEKKAKFLARQENGLLISQYRQQRFEEAGLGRYKWRTSGLTNVREDHRLLNGRIFSWSDPPIVDRATGRRGHAGEDYNCNCQALPIIE